MCYFSYSKLNKMIFVQLYVFSSEFISNEGGSEQKFLTAAENIF